MPVSCDLEVMWPDGPVACESENGLVRIRAICVHEHMEDAGCCALHLTLAAQHRVFCTECYDHDGHLCPVDYKEIGR